MTIHNAKQTCELRPGDVFIRYTEDYTSRPSLCLFVLTLDESSYFNKFVEVGFLDNARLKRWKMSVHELVGVIIEP